MDRDLRRHLLTALRGDYAPAPIDQALLNLPWALQGRSAAGMPFTAWQLLEHLRIKQWDIMETTSGPGHISPPWPDGFWPADPAPPSTRSWDECAAAFRADLHAMQTLVSDPANDLHRRLPWTDGLTLLGQALRLAQHNAYHLGQLVMLRRALGAWPP